MRKILALLALCALAPALMAPTGGLPYYPQFGGITINSQGPAVNVPTNVRAWNLFTYGMLDTAVACSFHANTGQAAQVNGWGAPQNIASFPSRDSVGCYIDNVGPPAVANVAGTFTTTTFTPSVAFSAGVLSKLRVGMLIDTNDATKYSGTVSAWAADGTSLTVSGWFQQGNTGAGQTPAGANAIINPVTHVWAFNTNCYLNGSSYSSGSTAGCTGYESDVSDTSPGAATNLNTAFDAVNTNGATAATRAYASRGSWTQGFRAESGSTAAFIYQPTGGFAVADGFLSTQGSGVAFHENSLTSGQFLNGNSNFTVNFAGQTDIGKQASAAAPALYLHSSGHAAGDVLISSSGGTGANDGTLQITATAMQFNAVPVATNSVGAFTATVATGCTTTPTASVGYEKVGNIVTLHWNAVTTCTSNTTTLLTDASIPAALRPGGSHAAAGLPVAEDNGAGTTACVKILTTGVMQFGKATAFGACSGGGGWTAAGTKGLDEFSVTYNVDTN